MIRKKYKDYTPEQKRKVNAQSTAWQRRNPEKVRAYKLRDRLQNPKKHVNYHRRKRYGLLPGEFEALLSAQGNRCAVCGTTSPGGRSNTWHIDHNHITEKVRGILCGKCNMGIGLFYDDPNCLEQAMKYLRQSMFRDLL